MNAETTRDWSPTLGSLRAFVSVAHYRSWEKVGKELRITPTAAAGRVSRLEGWLHRMLTMSGVPVEIYEVDGEEFRIVASEILNAFEKHCSRPPDPKSKIWKIDLYDLRSFLVVANHLNYKIAAHALDNQDPSTTLRTIKKIELALGNKKLFSGHSTLSLTVEGSAFLADVASIVAKLNNSRADLTGYIPDPLRAAKAAEKLVSKVKVRAAARVAVLEGRPQTKINRLHLEEAKAIQAAARTAHAEIVDKLGEDPGQSARDIDIEALINSGTSSS